MAPGPDRSDLIPLRVMAHPVRLRILSLLTGATLSATDVAAELEITHAAASYHLRELAVAGLIEPGDEEAAPRGAGRPPVRYRHVADYGDRLDRTDGRELLFGAMLQDLSRRHEAMRSQHQVADGEVWLPPAAWEEVCRLSDRIAEVMHEQAVPPRTAGATHASVTVAVFEL